MLDPKQHATLTSIVVPCWNQRGFTELCVSALFRHTRPAWELIVIDNGSTDDTAAYLAGVRDAASVPVTVIRNAQNVGFPRAINQGLQASRGEYLVLLNNDAVVSDGWLDQLIALTAVRAESGDRETSGRSDGGVGRPAPNECGVVGAALGGEALADDPLIALTAARAEQQCPDQCASRLSTPPGPPFATAIFSG